MTGSNKQYELAGTSILGREIVVEAFAITSSTRGADRVNIFPDSCSEGTGRCGKGKQITARVWHTRPFVGRTLM